MSACSKCYSEYTVCYKGCDTNDRFSVPLPAIGAYVAAASLFCVLLMAFDALKSFRDRTLWFPCKFFSLNAASITLLTVATKLPVDLTSPMPSSTNQLAKLSSNAFLCAAMANFMPSIASKNNREIFTNGVALAILVITIVVDIIIQLFTGLIVDLDAEHVAIVALMLLLLVILSFSALSVSSIKRDLESKYSEIFGNLRCSGIEDLVYKCWMMVQTGSLQFVMARSVTSSASGTISFLIILVLVQALIRMFTENKSFVGYSDYKWSTSLILVIQSFGVLLGSVAPAFRWFVTVSFKSPIYKGNQIRFRTEDHWKRNLEMWKENPIGLKIRKRKGRKIIQDAKDLMLTICITCLVCRKNGSNAHEPGPESHRILELSHCVTQLEGEEKLPRRVLKNICKNADKFVDKGRKKKPKHLLELLSTVRSFDREATPKCWSLPIVTLASIATVLVDAENQNVENLLSSVSEGLYYACLIEKHVFTDNKEQANSRNAAEIIWAGVELHHRWLDEDLKRLAAKGRTCHEKLHMLANVAEKKLTEFKNEISGHVEEDILDWPAHAVAAKSMERTTKTLLENTYEGDGSDWTDKGLFEKLCDEIGNLFCRCLCNLPGVVTAMCCSSRVEERKDNVGQAIRLLGETEDVLKLVHSRELENLEDDAD